MARLLLAAALTLAFAGAAPGHVDLPPEPDDPPLFDPGPPPPEPYEPLDGPPLGIDTHPVFRGARLGPYPRLGIDVELLVGELHGDFEHERGGHGSEIRTHADLPLGDEVAGAELTGWIQLTRSWMLTASYLIIGNEEDGELRTSFVHDGVFFDYGDEVEAELTVELAWVGARFLAVNDPDMKLGVPFGILWAREELSLENVSYDERAEAAVEAISPYLGLYLDAHFGYGFGFEGEIRLFAWGRDDDELFGYIDARAKLYMTLFDHVQLFAGVRAFALEYVDEGRDDELMDFGVTAFVFGASVYF